MQEDQQRSRLSLILMVFGIVLLIAGLVILWFELPSKNVTNVQQTELVAPDCKQLQTIEYVRCAHEVIRRIDAPAAWAGMSKDMVAETLESEWRMTSYSPSLIEMSCALNLFCPQHWVLAIGADGAPAVYRNRLGFSMERLNDASLSNIDEDTRVKLTQGISFDSEEALAEWVDAHEQL